MEMMCMQMGLYWTCQCRFSSIFYVNTTEKEAGKNTLNRRPLIHSCIMNSGYNLPNLGMPITLCNRLFNRWKHLSILWNIFNENKPNYNNEINQLKIEVNNLIAKVNHEGLLHQWQCRLDAALPYIQKYSKIIII